MTNNAGSHSEPGKLNRGRTIKSSVEIIGLQNRNFGPRFDYAKVTIFAEPSDKFEIIDLVSEDNEARRFGFPDKFVSGLLDALASTDQLDALTDVRVTLKAAEHHLIDSSPNAFVEAGRDAGRKLREASEIA